MGILLRQNENRSQYQEKLAAELRERAKQQTSVGEPVDQTKGSNYLKNTRQTSDRAWVGFVVGVVLVVGFIIFVMTR